MANQTSFVERTPEEKKAWVVQQRALGKIKQEDMDNIAKLGKLVESSMKKSLK